jgi:hypothetical protein
LTAAVLATTAAAGLRTAGFAAADLTAAGLGADFCGFTGTFELAVVGLRVGGGRAAFLATATLRVAFLGIAFPGRLAALFGFFEGICRLRLLTKERAIIPTHCGLYRPSRAHLLTIFNILTI